VREPAVYRRRVGAPSRAEQILIATSV